MGTPPPSADDEGGDKVQRPQHPHHKRQKTVGMPARLQQQSTEECIRALHLEAPLTTFLVQSAQEYEQAVASPLLVGSTAAHSLTQDALMKHLRDTRHLLIPGAGISDGAKGIMAAFSEWLPGMPKANDYAHISWKHSQGRFLGKDHPRYGEVAEVIYEMHHCPTVGAWDVLCTCLREHVWKQDPAMLSMFQQLFVAPNNKWHLGVLLVGGVIPSQNVHEVCYQLNSNGRTASHEPPSHPPVTGMASDSCDGKAGADAAGFNN